LPATFKEAIAGKQVQLVERIDLQHSGLLLKLLDRSVITACQKHAIEVIAASAG